MFVLSNGDGITAKVETLQEARKLKLVQEKFRNENIFIFMEVE